MSPGPRSTRDKSRLGLAATVVAMAVIAVLSPTFASRGSASLVSLLLIGAGLLEIWHGFRRRALQGSAPRGSAAPSRSRSACSSPTPRRSRPLASLFCWPAGSRWTPSGTSLAACEVTIRDGRPTGCCPRLATRLLSSFSWCCAPTRSTGRWRSRVACASAARPGTSFRRPCSRCATRVEPPSPISGCPIGPKSPSWSIASGPRKSRASQSTAGGSGRSSSRSSPSTSGAWASTDRGSASARRSSR